MGLFKEVLIDRTIDGKVSMTIHALCYNYMTISIANTR